MNDIIREFLIETHENLAQLDLDLVTLEKQPTERDTLDRVFRTLHTVKGTAGFLGLQSLQTVAHAAESLLAKLRAGEMTFNAEIASALLQVVDAIRQMLQAVEATEKDGDGDYSALIETLDRLRAAGASGPAPAQGNVHRIVSTPIANPQAELQRTVANFIPASTAPQREIDRSATIVSTDSAITEAVEARGPAVSDSTIRVDVGLLDKLMNLVGELVLARNQVLQYSSSQENANFQGTVQRLNLLTTELQAGVMKTRMQPISNIWGKFPRVVRDLALACGKQARLDMEGQATELDKTLIEAIRDPLTHLVRNSVDHGIESPADRAARGKPAEGRLSLHAFHEGGNVIIEIADDGAGIDPQRVRAKAIQAKLISPEQADRLSDRDMIDLIFLPGFSTADKVTQFSGRGVGMDVVRTNIEKIGGTVAIESRLGAGTTIRMKIPLTLAIIPALTVTSDGDRYAIPQVSLLELVRLEGDSARRGIESMHGAPVYRLRGRLLPLVFLGDQLHPGRSTARSASDGEMEINIVVLQADDRQFGLVVDAIHDTEEIVVKPLQKQVKNIGVFSGATIMGDGRVALILDVLSLAQRSNVVTGARERALGETDDSTAETGADRQKILLFSTPDGGRMAIPLALVHRLEEFPRSGIERVGPFEVVQYRNEILPLIPVAQLLQSRARQTRGRKSAAASRPSLVDESALDDSLHVVVYAHKNQRLGLVVDRILDIAEESLESRSAGQRPGVLFQTVIQGRVTEFLDLEGIMRDAEPDFFEDPQALAVEA